MAVSCRFWQPCLVLNVIINEFILAKKQLILSHIVIIIEILEWNTILHMEICLALVGIIFASFMNQ